MWLNILKYAVKIAVATGLADKGKSWIIRKIQGAADKTEYKLRDKLSDVEDKVDEIYGESGSESIGLDK